MAAASLGQNLEQLHRPCIKYINTHVGIAFQFRGASDIYSLNKFIFAMIDAL